MSRSFVTPIDCSLQGCSVHGISQARNTGVGYHFLLQGVFPTQELNPCLLLGRWIPYTEPPGKPYITMCVLSRFSHIQLFAILWTIACQPPLSMIFSRQEYWSGLPCPPSEDLPDPEVKPTCLASPALAGRFFTTSATWEPTKGL